MRPRKLILSGASTNCAKRCQRGKVSGVTPLPPSFRLVSLREGYDTAEVDAFVLEVLAEIDGGRASAALADRIDQIRFTPTRIRQGYNMDDVDACLDELRQVALQGHRPA
jgi:DivIVA domain-containing protein